MKRKDETNSAAFIERVSAPHEAENHGEAFAGHLLARPQNALFSSIKNAKVNASNDKQVREKPDAGPQRSH